MICKYPNLTHEMRNHNWNTSDIASLIGEDEDTVRLKMARLIPWSLSDAIIISNELGVDDLRVLFCPL